MLWVMALVGAFFAGAEWQRRELAEGLLDAQHENDTLRLMVNNYERITDTLQIEAARSGAALETEVRKAAAMRKKLAESPTATD
jgi:hypothetical protein